MKNKYLPSFCAACYRASRTGDRFMEWAKTGKIATYCQANAVLTLKEYLTAYASKRVIEIVEGHRDFRF